MSEPLAGPYRGYYLWRFRSVAARPLAEFDGGRVIAVAVAFAVLFAAAVSPIVLLQTGRAHPIGLSIYDPALDWAGLTATVTNLRHHGTYLTVLDELPMRAHRLPLTPLLMAAFSFLSERALSFLIVKNALLYGLLAAVTAARAHRRTTVGTYALYSAALYLNPVLLYALPFTYEEGFTTFLLPAAFVLVTGGGPRAPLWAGMLSGAVYLIKSAAAPSALALAVIAAMRARGAAYRVGALLPLAVAVIGWGTFTLHSTGHFAWGPSGSSFNGPNLYKANNPLTERIYPSASLDKMDGHEASLHHDAQGHTFVDEWAMHRHYTAAATRFMAADPAATLRRLGVRVWLTFGRVREWARTPGGLPLWPSLLVDRVALWLALGVALAHAVRACPERRRTARAFLAVTLAYSAPLIVGFVYMRHLAPLFALALVYLLFALSAPRASSA